MDQWFADFISGIEAMRMTLDGAALLATLYPIGILAVIIDVRTIARRPRVPIGRPKPKPGKSGLRVRVGLYDRASAGMIAVLGFPAFMSIPSLAIAVASGVPLKGWGVAFVSTSGWLLSTAVTVLFIELVWLAFSADLYGTDDTPAPATAPRPPRDPKGAPSKRPRKRR